MIVLVSATVAIGGYLRAATLFRREQGDDTEQRFDAATVTSSPYGTVALTSPSSEDDDDRPEEYNEQSRQGHHA